jgi:hypothetical protein
MFLPRWLLLEIRWSKEDALAWDSLLPSRSSFLQSELHSYNSCVTVFPAGEEGRIGKAFPAICSACATTAIYLVHFDVITLTVQNR